MLPKKRRMYSNNGGSLSVWDQAQFFAPLKTTLVLSRGTGSPTFTRATTAYVTDFEGLLKQVPSGCARFTGARMVLNWLTTTSENFSNAAWAKDATTTVTAGQTDPIGGTTAYKIENVTAADGVYNACSGFPTTAGNTFTASIWIKGAVGGEVVNLGYLNTTATVTASTSWQRMSVTALTNDIFFRIRPQGANSTIYVWRALGEDVTGQTITAPSEYVSVGVLSAPYHGAGVDGVKYFDTENGNTVTSNVVTEATGAAIADATLKGYLSEGQRQNRCLHSQDFTNAAWVSGGGGIAVTPNTAVAPDGTTTADTLTASGANGTLIQDLGVVASAAKAGGLYLKRKTGTGNIDLTLDGGATWTTVAVTSSWLLLEKTQTLADEDFGIRIVTSGDEVYAWQAQVETAAFLSSPIPTTTAAVTRNADVLTYPTAGNINNTAGSAYAETQCARTGMGQGNILDVSGTGPNPLYRHSANYAAMYDGTNLVGDESLTLNNTTRNKSASSWGATQSITTNAATILTGAYDGGYSIGANMAIGINLSSNSATFGANRNVRIWTKALSDAQLVSMTT